MKQFFSQSKWIGTGERLCDPNVDYFSPALQLRKVFRLSSKPTAALCRICGLGAYVLYINGKRVGDDVLSPAFTAYDKRVLFVEYDVYSYLCAGENVVAIKLGDGFYNQTSKDVWGFYRAPWRDYNCAIFELIADGGIVCVSDNTWKWTKDGPTIHSAVRTGEYYDARKEDGWRVLGYQDDAWHSAVVVASPGGVLDQMTMPPIRECESYSPVDVWRSEKGWVFDFGKNIAGYVGIMDLTKAGDLIRGRTVEAFMPLSAVAIVDLLLVMRLTWLVGKLERRLRKSER